MKDQRFRKLTDFLLQQMQQRPGLYLKEPGISNLSTFLIGYNLGRIMGKAAGNDFFEENGFIQWLLHKKKNTTAPFWEAILMEEADNDEFRALELFFEYLEEFKTKTNRTP